MTDVPEVESGVLTVNGASLAYDIAGAGPALVLIHEGIADRHMFDDQVRDLARHYRVVRYDLPGFGQSGKPQEPYTHHETLHALLRHLGIERAALLGMSLGGIVAIDFTLTYPTMVGALVLMAAAVGGYTPSEASAALFAPLVEAFEADDFGRAIDLSVRLWVDGPGRSPEDVDPSVRERVRSMYMEVLRRSRDPGHDASPLDPPAITRLHEIRVPVLVVVGTGDIPDVQDQAELLARTIPDAQKVEIPGVGHVLNMERPGRVNGLVLDFLLMRFPPSSAASSPPRSPRAS